MQTTFDTFMGPVEVATVKAEATIKEVAGDGGVYLFQAKPDMFGGIEVAKELTKIWTRIYHHGSIDKFFDVTLAVLEHREDEYMKLIEGLNADVLKGYTEMFGTLAAYFIDGNYSDPLGTFYSEHFKNKMGGSSIHRFMLRISWQRCLTPNRMVRCSIHVVVLVFFYLRRVA